MKDRWLTLLCALGALVAFYSYFIGPVHGPGEPFSRPLTTELRANGYFAARHWLETQGVPVTVLGHRYDWLFESPGLPPRGNLLVTTIPHKLAARPSEVLELHAWLEQGNALLVVAGVFDTPEWGMPDTVTPFQLYSLTGLALRGADEPEGEPEDEAAGEEEGEAADEAGDEEEAAAGPQPLPGPPMRLAEPKRGALVPIADHPLTRGLKSVHAESEFPAGKFRVASPERSPMLALMTDAESGLHAAWLTWVGEGPVLVSGYGSVLTNKLLAHGDNARLLANVVHRLLGPGGHVIFDDIHQGAASFYDAEAFFGDARLHATLWWIVLLWLVWVLGSTRLPPPAGRAAPVRERAFLDSTGHFFARVLDRRHVAGRQFANFFNDCRRAIGREPDGKPLWDWMRGSGVVRHEDIDRLEALYRRVAAGKRVDLVALHNRLQQLRKQLL